MDIDKMLRVGVVVSAHGIKGEVKVYPTTDDPKRFKKLKKAYLKSAGEMTACEVKSARFFKNLVILALEGITDRDMAERIKKQELWIDREDAVELSQDEFFITDLIGMQVISDEDDVLIGTIRDVIQTGANDVYEIELDDGFAPGGKRPEGGAVLAPVIKECVKSVDLAQRRIRLHLMPGLIESCGL